MVVGRAAHSMVPLSCTMHCREVHAKILPVASVVSMPSAAQAIPNMWAREKLMKIAMAITMQGMIADL